MAPDVPRAYTNHCSPTPSYPNCDGARFPPTVSAHYLTCNVQLAILQPCNRLAWVWQTRWHRLNGEECMLCRWIYYLNCARAVEIAGAAWWARVSSLSHLGVLKNRSSADPEVIEGGKDRGGERNGVTVMVSCLLLVSCPDLFWKNWEGIL